MNLYANQEGFTLIESLIAIAIFSIGFLAVAAMQTNSLQSTTESRKITEAMEVATSKAEFLQGLPFYPNFPDDVNEDSNIAAGTHTKTKKYYGTERYKVEWLVTDMTDSAHTVTSVHADDPLVIFKNIEIKVYDLHSERLMAEMEFLKVCEQDVR